MEERAAREFMRALGMGNIVKNRDWLNCSCPLAPYSRAHKSTQDNRPSFGICTEVGKPSYYSCFTCHNSGSLWQLAADLGRYRKKDYTELQKKALLDDVMSLTDYDYEGDEEDQLHAPLDEAIYGGLYPPAWEFKEARDFLHARGISANTSRVLDLGYDKDDWRVVFPVRDNNNNLYGFSGRSVLAEKDYPIYSSNRAPYAKVKDYLDLPKRHLLLGEHRARPGLPFVVLEGLMGYARFVEIGAEALCNPVAVMGNALTDFKAERLMRWNQKTYLLSDPDMGGDVFLWGKINKKTGEHSGGGAVDLLYQEVPTFVPEFPDGVTDVDDLTLEQLKHMLDNTPMY